MPEMALSLPDLRTTLRSVFEIAEHPLHLQSRAEKRAGNAVHERLTFRNQAGEPVRGLLTRPSKAAGRRPAILYIHAHGARYDIGASELTDGRPALQAPLGPILAEAGYVTLAIDLPCFGERSHVTESAAAKASFWTGKTLAGQMLGELASALDYLAGRPDVDPVRIGAFGISMGSTFGYWLAAVDTRIAALMQLCCFADFSELVKTGAHDLHGIYLSIPGLLGIASNGQIAGLVAPRPQLVCIGDQDPLTPPHAFEAAFAQAKAAYEAAGAAGKLVLHREAQTGHEESPEMRQHVIAFAAEHLTPEQIG